MPTPIVVPKSTITMSQGTILQWMKGVGDQVAKDEALLEVETDKAVVEVPAPEAGTLLRIDLAKGEVAIDQVIGWIGNRGESIPEDRDAPAEAQKEAPILHRNNNQAQSEPPILATPAARRRAKELGIDIRSVAGSGPNQRITEDNVENYAKRQSLSAGSSRRALAEHVTEAWRTVPHIHIVRSMDMDRIVKTKALASKEAGPSVTYTDIILSTVATTLAGFDALLSGPRSGNRPSISLAFAVDTEHGVVAPVIHEANHLRLGELARIREDLASLARLRKLRPEHLEVASFTVTNLGMYDVDLFAPIINTPQIAILAVGKIQKQPIVDQDQVRSGWRMWATLAADHRHIDGVLAARFLSAWQVAMNEISQEQTADK
jgi:pyruvate dehydrogenase E2 component (dihydrolipoamide acetyltransferase)